MKKTWIIIIAVVAILFIVGMSIFGWFKNTYNDIIVLEEGVSANWAQVENVYQRRADLIPNLVNTVKGYAAHAFGVTLAVSFVVAAFVLGDGLRSSFTDVSEDITAGVDIEVRPVS